MASEIPETFLKIITSFGRHSLHLQMAGDTDPGAILQQAFGRGVGSDFNVILASGAIKNEPRESAGTSEMHLAHMGRIGLELVRDMNDLLNA
jgi:hypothetical protein